MSSHMYDGPDADTGRDPSQVSIGQLMGNISSDLSTLMRQEVQLAKAELKQEAGKAGKGAGMLSGAAVAGYLTILFLSIALWWALANMIDSLGWAALIVAIIWAVIAAVLFTMGRKEMKKVNPVPEQTVETVKETPEAFKTSTGRSH